MNSSHWLKLVLIISLALNLLAAGFLIGRVMDRKGAPNMHMRWAIEEIDESTREKISASMRDHFRETRPLRHALRRAQKDLSDTVIKEPFDADAGAEAFADVRSASQALQTSMHEQMLENLGELNAKEREQVFQAFLRRGPRGPHGSASAQGKGPRLGNPHHGNPRDILENP